MDKTTNYHKRKSKGLCPLCGKAANDGYVICESCREKNRSKSNARMMQGLCVQCGQPSRENKSLCVECSLRQANAKKQLREKRKAKGVCTRCGKATDGVHIHCDDCRKYAKEGRDVYVQYGICNRCHREKIYGNEKTCPECKAEVSLINTNYRMLHRQKINKRERELHKIHYEERKAKGICTRCGKNKASDGRFTCISCREKNNKEKRLAYVKILVDRPNRCRYCNNDSAPGYKVCEEHRQKLSISATSRKVNEARKKTRARLNW